MSMSLRDRTGDLIRADVWRMECLIAAQGAGLPDWMIVAGFVRNLIWDHLHQRLPRTPLNDVDLVFFDPNDLSVRKEQQAEARLTALYPHIRWQVRNQARMHLKNGHSPYKRSEDAISYYPELETCIGVSLAGDGRLIVVAPHGLQHNWALTVQSNAKTGYPRTVVEKRASEKRWLEIWPSLRMIKVASENASAAPETG